MTKKQPTETKKQSLIRRLKEYIEYSEAVKRYADVEFYKEIIEYIDTE